LIAKPPGSRRAAFFASADFIDKKFLMQSRALATASKTEINPQQKNLVFNLWKSA